MHLHKRIRIWVAFSSQILAVLLFTVSLHSAVLNVGPGQRFATPCGAIAAAADGDTILIDAAGTYRGDVCAWSKNRLTIRGVNGRPKIEAGGKASQGKAIWVIAGSDTTIENVELTGASVPDHNGAGIRQEGSNLVVRNCYIHDNEDGILTGANPNSEILIEHTEFANNGYPDGMAHNIYIGRIAKFTMRFSYSHDVRVGHLVKSRALQNYILYNRLTGEGGTASYEIDLPNSGLSVVVGNVIQKGPLSENPSSLSYGREGLANPDRRLYFVNNTVINHRAVLSPMIAVAAGIAPVLVQNNIFSGTTNIINQPAATLSHNFIGNARFADPGRYDYHLLADSPARDFGATPDGSGEYPLSPVSQYVHPICFEARVTTGPAVDAGAFEFAGGGGASCAGSAANRLRVPDRLPVF